MQAHLMHQLLIAILATVGRTVLAKKKMKRAKKSPIFYFEQIFAFY